MALQKQTFPISFAQGIDTKTDPKQVIPGKLLTLENGYFITPGEIRKRNGYLQLNPATVAGTEISTGYGLASFNSELLMFDGNKVYSYTSSVDLYKEKGRAVSASVDTTPIVRNLYEQSSPDSCYHETGFSVYVWEDSRGGSRFCVKDMATGQLLIPDSSISDNAINAKCFPLGNRVIIVYYDTVIQELLYKAILASNPATIPSSPTTISTTIDTTNPMWDGTIIGTRLFLTWNGDNGAGSIETQYMNQFLSLSAVETVLAENADVAINIVGDTQQNAIVSYYNGTSVKTFAYNYNLDPIVTTQTVETVANIVNVSCTPISGEPVDSILPIDDNCIWLYTQSDATSYNYKVLKAEANLITAGLSGLATSVLIRSVGLSSKSFTYLDKWYALVSYESTLQPTYFIVDIESVFAIAKVSPQTGGGHNATYALTETYFIDEDTIQTAFLETDTLTTQSGNVYTNSGVMSLSLNFLSSNTFLRAQASNNLHITGGYLSMYDGNSVVEHGFHLYPETPSNSASGIGGSITAGTRQYVVTYEWTDNYGNVHRSAPSIPLSVTNAGATSTNTLTIATLRITNKITPRTPVSIVLYRTIASGTIFYRVSSITSPTVNSTTVDTANIIDQAADSTIIGNELLYTTGGVIENIATPAPALITNFRNRVIVVPSENRYTFWLSQETIPNTPVEFNDSFVKNIDPKGGGITAIESLDDKLVLFKSRSIYATAGQGPTRTGTNDDIGDPEFITADTGCQNPRSVVITPVGIMFQSPKGIYRLTRAMQAEYIGAPVEAFNNYTITSALLIPNTNQVRFTTSEGICLVYDYLFNQWATFTNHDAADSTIFNGVFNFLRPNGPVWQETIDSFTDNSAFIKLRLVTSWLSFGGLQNFQRVYKAILLGEYKSPHNLFCQVAYDFKPVYSQEITIDVGSVIDPTAYGDDSPYGEGSPYGGEDPTYQFELNFARQKCESIKVSIEDLISDPYDYGESLSISAINLEVGIKQGLNKLPAIRRFG